MSEATRNPAGGGLTQNVNLLMAPSVDVLSILEHDWARLRGMIQKIVPPDTTYVSWSACLYGIAATAAFAGVAFTTTLVGTQRVVLAALSFSLTAVCLVSGVVCTHFTKKTRKLESNTKQDALDEMDSLEKRCRVDTEKAPDVYKGYLEFLRAALTRGGWGDSDEAAPNGGDEEPESAT